MAKKRQKSEDLVGFYLRVPAVLKKKIDDLAEKKSCSQAQVVVEIIEQGIDGPPAPAPAAVDAWLQRQ
jgi:predicted transcriptional regulator